MNRQIVRFRSETGAITIGVLVNGDIHLLNVPTIGVLLTQSKEKIGQLVQRAISTGDPVTDTVEFLAPIDGHTEVWAAGVTYLKSKAARIEESAQASVYELVYDAERPEIFFKAPAWRVITSHDELFIRDDSELNVPEPELAVVVNAYGEIVGYAICNDMSSRSIEGANPLYLPQAKVYDGSCALSNNFVLVDFDEPTHREITMEIERDGRSVWSGSSNTSKLKRSLRELIDAAHSHLAFPEGFFLSTGTGIVPEFGFSVQARDVVTIRIDGLGSLVNLVGVRSAKPLEHQETAQAR